MPRPRIRRRLRFQAKTNYFKPAGVPLSQLDEVLITRDELEALKHYHFDQLDQTAAAKEMAISQPTFARTVKKAHGKIADALVNAKAIHLEE